MKTKSISLLIASIFVLALVFTVGSPAAPTGKGLPAARAKAHLEHAAHDFGGHRVEAIRAIDDAIHQLDECLRYDKN